MTPPHADVNSVHLYYERHGAGDPVVLVHGGLLTIELSWSQLIPLLAADHEVIAVELQGHGHTPDIDRDFTPANNAADILALLDELGIEKASFIGHSTGAAAVLEIAVRHPERVVKCVALSGSVKPGVLVEEFDHPETIMESPRTPTPEEMGAMAESYARHSSTPENFEAFAGKIASAPDGEGFTDEELGRMTAPLLVVHGDLDFTRLEHLAEIQRLVPGAQIGILPGTTHTQVPTRVDLLYPMLKAFLA